VEASNHPIRVISVAESEQQRGDMRERCSLPLDIGIFFMALKIRFGISGFGILLPRKRRFSARISWLYVFLMIVGTFPMLLVQPRYLRY
jgi:hypothetical protein